MISPQRRGGSCVFSVISKDEQADEDELDDRELDILSREVRKAEQVGQDPPTVGLSRTMVPNHNRSAGRFSGGSRLPGSRTAPATGAITQRKKGVAGSSNGVC